MRPKTSNEVTRVFKPISEDAEENRSFAKIEAQRLTLPKYLRIKEEYVLGLPHQLSFTTQPPSNVKMGNFVSFLPFEMDADKFREQFDLAIKLHEELSEKALRMGPLQSPEPGPQK